MSVTIICQRQRDRQQCSKTIIGWPCCWRTVSACSRLLLFSGWFQWQLKSKAAAVANGQIQLLYCKHDLSQQLSIHAVDWLRLQETHQRVKTTIIPIFCAQINPICPFQVYLWALIGIHFCDSASKKVGWVEQFNQRRCGLNLECMKAVFLKKFEFVPASFMFVFKSCGVFSVENLFHLAYVCQQWVVCGYINMLVLSGYLNVSLTDLLTGVCATAMNAIPSENNTKRRGMVQNLNWTWTACKLVLFGVKLNVDASH